MDKNINYLLEEFNNNHDFIYKKVKVNIFSTAYLFFFETLVSQDKINEFILKKLTNINILNVLNDLPGSNIKKVNDVFECEDLLYSGFIIIYYHHKFYALEAKASIDRNVSTNEVETAIKGPKNAFIENYQVNLGLIKRRIHTHHLKINNLKVGNISKTNVGILYLDNKVDQDLLNKTYEKIKNINIDLVNDSSNILNVLSDKTVFPTVINTERPDRCAEALSEGKIVIICDEAPSALIVPAFLVDFINPFTDRYANNFNANFTKVIRLLCFFLSIIIPAFYISIINYNQEAIPTSLIVNFAIQRDGVPFPAIIECLLMLIICEILRESDIRFPSKYGSAISILGALVLGEAAVSAGLVSPIMIIITAFTYISSLIFNEQEIGNALRWYRFIFLFFSALLGLYGLLIAFIFFMVDLTSINSMGHFYTFPISPFNKEYFYKYFWKKKRNKK